jgi:cytochrome c oxidase subunit 3
LADFAETLPEERVQHQASEGIWFEEEGCKTSYSLNEVVEGFKATPNILFRTEQLNEEGEKTLLDRKQSLAKILEANQVVEGANLIHNEYGHRLFADFFFFITGFHGFHVFSGVVINVIIFFNVILGTYQRRGHYEMVEKVGLYWHFVDLVWVFVFTFFYLV